MSSFQIPDRLAHPKTAASDKIDAALKNKRVGAFHIEDSDEEAQEGNVEEEAKETVEEIIPVETAPVVVPVECKFNSLFLLVKQRK